MKQTLRSLQLIKIHKKKKLKIKVGRFFRKWSIFQEGKEIVFVILQKSLFGRNNLSKCYSKVVIQGRKIAAESFSLRL